MYNNVYYTTVFFQGSGSISRNSKAVCFIVAHVTKAFFSIVKLKLILLLLLLLLTLKKKSKHVGLVFIQGDTETRTNQMVSFRTEPAPVQCCRFHYMHALSCQKPDSKYNLNKKKRCFKVAIESSHMRNP